MGWASSIRMMEVKFVPNDDIKFLKGVIIALFVLPSALDGSEWSDSHSGRFNPLKNTDAG